MSARLYLVYSMEPPFFPKPHLPMSFRFLFISSAPLLPQLIHLPPQHSFSLTGLSTQTKTSSLHLTLQFPNCSDRQAHAGISGPSHDYSVQFCAGKLPLAMCNVVSICWCAAQIPKSALLLTGVYFWHLVYLG